MSDSDFEFIDEDDEFEDAFDASARYVQDIYRDISSSDLLELYGLYKQATVGNCNISKPSFFNFQACAKWTAWHNLANMSSKEAMQKYVEKVHEIDPTWCGATNGETKKHLFSWVVHSVELPLNVEQPKPEHEKTIFDFVRDGNLAQVTSLLETANLQMLDENGMAIIHWAADANNVEMLKLILSSGCPVDLRDKEEQTALHYAASCGHMESAKLLLEHGADVSAKDISGQTCFEVADDNQMCYLLS